MKRMLLRMPDIILLLILVLGTSMTSGCGPNVLTVAFTTPSQVLDAGVASGNMTVQIQNAKSKPFNVKADTVINLTSTSTTGRFDTSTSGLFNGNTASVTIPSGSSSASFYYKDITAGTPTITATELPSQGWNRGTQQEKVNPALNIVTASMPNGDAGTAYSLNLGASGGSDTYTWAVSSGSLPTDLVLNGNTISGTPTTAGITNFTIEISDGISTATKKLSLTINPMLTISTISLPHGDPNISYTQSLTASGGSSNYTWSITDGTLPAGLSLNGSTGVISGTPTAVATSDFTIKVSDGIGTAIKPLSLMINGELTIVTALLPNGTQNTAYSQTLAAAGGSGNYTWTITGGALPTGLSLTGNTISGTPTNSGEFNFTVQVSDGIGSVARGVSITINRIR